VLCNKYLCNELLIRKLVKSNLFVTNQNVIVGIEIFIKRSKAFKEMADSLFESMTLFICY
jgi:hypothetical protein